MDQLSGKERGICLTGGDVGDVGIASACCVSAESSAPSDPIEVVGCRGRPLGNQVSEIDNLSAG